MIASAVLVDVEAPEVIAGIIVGVMLAKARKVVPLETLLHNSAEALVVVVVHLHLLEHHGLPGAWSWFLKQVELGTISGTYTGTRLDLQALNFTPDIPQQWHETSPPFNVSHTASRPT